MWDFLLNNQILALFLLNKLLKTYLSLGKTI